MEIQIVRRPRTTHRRRDVIVGVVATTSVLAAVLVVVEAADPSRSPDRPPGFASVHVPDAPVDGWPTGDDPSADAGHHGDPGPSGPVGSVDPSARPVALDLDTMPGAATAAVPAGDAVPAATPYDDGPTPDQTAGPARPAAGGGLLTRTVDPVLHELGAAAPVVEPVAESVRQVGRGLTTCLDSAAQSLQIVPALGCLPRG
jgi:hypothetical protein